MRDPLQVRAFYVSNGRRAVAFVVVDAQGYFSGYQEGPNFGILADRIDAARAASATGRVHMTEADIIEQATHTHAGPTLEGIWGPVPRVYLQLVHDQVVVPWPRPPGMPRRPTSSSPPWTTATSPPSTSTRTTTRAGSPILRSRSSGPWQPRTGATIATFDSVPTHGAHVCGQCLRLLSADYFGAVRAQLDRELGAVNVVGTGLAGPPGEPGGDDRHRQHGVDLRGDRQ